MSVAVGSQAGDVDSIVSALAMAGGVLPQPAFALAPFARSELALRRDAVELLATLQRQPFRPWRCRILVLVCLRVVETLRRGFRDDRECL